MTEHEKRRRKITDDAAWSVIRARSENLAGIHEKDRYDVVLANPTFGAL
jgi:hypothetical protein